MNSDLAFITNEKRYNVKIAKALGVPVAELFK